MGKQWGDLTNTIRALSERKIGVSLREVADTLDRPLNVSSGFVTRLVRAGELIKGGIHGEYRYFADIANAEVHNIEAAQALKERQDAYKKRQNVLRAKRGREKRAKDRADAGLPPYVKPVKKDRVLKAKRQDIKPRNSGLYFSTAEQDREHKKTQKEMKIVWPDHVKVQVIPTGKDERYSFAPKPGWKGQITRDWYDRRLAA